MSSKISCIFCKIISGDIPSHHVYEDKKYLAFLDIQPISPGHVLVVPKNHSNDLLEANADDLKGLLEIVAKITPAILRATGASGFNVGVNTGKDAGQLVMHTHIHIIPRRAGDGLRSWGTHAKEKNSPSESELAEISGKIRQFM